MTDFFYYSPATGELIVTDTPASWMASTNLPPPAFAPATQGCFFRNGAWVIVDAVPDTTQRRAEILTRLAAIDTESIRPAREVSAALAAGQLAPAFSVSKLAALEAEAAALRTELRDLPETL